MIDNLPSCFLVLAVLVGAFLLFEKRGQRWYAFMDWLGF